MKCILGNEEERDLISNIVVGTLDTVFWRFSWVRGRGGDKPPGIRYREVLPMKED